LQIKGKISSDPRPFQFSATKILMVKMKILQNNQEKNLQEIK